MFNYDALAQWWNLQMKDAKKPYWVLHRGAGGKAGQTIATYGNDDVDASWTALVETISNAGSQGVYEFVIVVRPGGANDTTGKREFQLRSSALNAQNPQLQQPGIYGMQPYGYPSPAVDIAGITETIKREMDEKHRLERTLELERIQNKYAMERLEEKIEGLAESQVPMWERLLGALENPETARGLINGIQMLKGFLSPQGVPMAAPSVGATTAQRRPAPKSKVVEMPPEPDTEGDTDENDETPDGVPVYEELAGEYDCAIEAVNLLAENGWDAPGELLQKVAKWAIANPAMAKGLIQNL